jgi:hypothetical protein
MTTKAMKRVMACHYHQIENELTLPEPWESSSSNETLKQQDIAIS